MSKICEICNKRPRCGNQVSHSGKRASRWWYPNVQKIKVKLSNGKVRTIKVCASCIKAGKIQKSVS
ncbi:MAG: 50S ribosomal protein L28 [Thermodesulfobacteriaceae bacterium]|nr:50S ribosomal protein L28 [Thermodesulfobacteriaceae bacterium]MCX8042207.1 50S ribosomal protein L28 [Thermodesulfobacteriaceae bacterium]MDW8136438.1 50S ribosomal protein L28 [Thermodesulfobacterium sp.]